jgi:hypothetical protein
MVHYVMLTLNPTSKNVRGFQNWCVSLGLSHELCLGTVPKSVDEVKANLTPYGYYNMFNHREAQCHFDTLSPIGCFMGHQSAWKICRDRKEITWIFEEGTYSFDTPDFQFLEREHPTMDFLLGHTVTVCRTSKQTRIGTWSHDRMIEPIDKIYYGTKCYRMSPDFATLALKESETFELHVDSFLCVLAIYYRDMYVTGRTSHNIVGARSSGSIQHSMDTRLFFSISIIVLGLATIVLFLRYRSCRNKKQEEESLETN